MHSDDNDTAQTHTEGEKRAGIERHAQSIMLAVITAIVLYSGTFVIGAREDAVRFTGQIAVLVTEVGALRTQLHQMQGNYVVRDEYRDHEQRLRVLEAHSRASRLGPQ